MHLKIDALIIRIEPMVCDGKARGYFDATKQLIQIEVSQSPASQADTLIHEILHAIWSSRHMKPRLYEEQAVTQLASGLATVLRDNPDLPLWLEQALIENVPIVT